MRTIAAVLALAALGLAQQVATIVHQEIPGLLATYHAFHEHPELSHFEAQTSAVVA